MCYNRASKLQLNDHFICLFCCMIHESFYLINSAAVNNVRNTNRSKKNDRPVSACMLTSTGCANGGTWERVRGKGNLFHTRHLKFKTCRDMKAAARWLCQKSEEDRVRAGAILSQLIPVCSFWPRVYPAHYKSGSGNGLHWWRACAFKESWTELGRNAQKAKICCGAGV